MLALTKKVFVEPPALALPGFESRGWCHVPKGPRKGRDDQVVSLTGEKTHETEQQRQAEENEVESPFCVRWRHGGRESRLRAGREGARGRLPDDGCDRGHRPSQQP